MTFWLVTTADTKETQEESRQNQKESKNTVGNIKGLIPRYRKERETRE